MSDGQDTGLHRALPSRFMRAALAARAALTAYDGRRSTIERLEHELAEERDGAEALRRDVAELRFQAETLEKTYSKQLTDARLRSEAAERELAELRSRLATLENAHDDATRSLTEARDALERVSTDRDLLRDVLASSDSPDVAAVRKSYSEARYRSGLATIDELMDESCWPRETRPADDTQPEADAEAAPDAEYMLSPDLVFVADEASEDEPGR